MDLLFRVQKFQIFKNSKFGNFCDILAVIGINTKFSILHFTLCVCQGLEMEIIAVYNIKILYNFSSN